MDSEGEGSCSWEVQPKRGSVGSFSAGNKKIGERLGLGGSCCILGLCMAVTPSSGQGPVVTMEGACFSGPGNPEQAALVWVGIGEEADREPDLLLSSGETLQRTHK